MKILLIGPQGSGKSTQAEFLAEYLKIPKISTGDIFRKIAKQNSEEGRKIKQIQIEGRLVDDETTAEVVKKKVSKDNCKNGFILDGYPRNLSQREIFDPGFDKVIYLKVPEEELIKRLMARSREDDTPGSIKTRLNLYYQQTRPLLDYYRNLGILTEVNGMGTVEEVQNEIKKSI